ncbi:hypothetical protein HUU53_03795 [Candidatus Micrarchaeota archaeon]|nr:hypothetical protein [Candidatus Micrarchaeota archaeon]
MKAVIEVSFDSKELASKALRVIGKQNISKKAVVKGVLKEKNLVFTFESDSFAGLRALTTTLFRDLKIFFDSLEIVRKEKA